MLCRVSSFSLRNTTQAELLNVLPPWFALKPYLQNLIENHFSWRHSFSYYFNEISYSNFKCMRARLLNRGMRMIIQYIYIYILGLIIFSLDYFKHKKHGSKRYKAKWRKQGELPEQEVEQRCREVKSQQV